MDSIIVVFSVTLALAFGSVLGYLARQSIARHQLGSTEAELQKKIDLAKKQGEEILNKAKEEAEGVLAQTRRERETRRQELLKAEQTLIKREEVLDNHSKNIEQKDQELSQRIGEIKKDQEEIKKFREKYAERLEEISSFSKEKAKEELFKTIEQDNQKDLIERMKKLEEQNRETLEKRAKEIVALSIQKCSISQSQELTLSTISLPNEEIKGRIIGKEGRNIRAFEKLTGVEVIVDDSPEVIVISCFDPIRRQIAKVALEKLIQDGRIQPARIEEEIGKAKEKIKEEIKEAGDMAIFETGIIGLDARITQLLGRLKFRTSYGQNVLLHSIEVSLLAGFLASEIGADVRVAKTAGLLHDIGKAVDRQIEGSHVDIGAKILEKFGVEEEVIKAMKSHHEDYPYENLEAILIQASDAISGARPGARKDTFENYVKRLTELEDLANSFKGVEKSYAIQAGRELRVFVRPGEVNDLEARQLAKDIAERIQEEIKYPGEIIVTVIRETRVVEYAK
ncbi:MAG: ribonuclease Y [bacterium]|nr:ribonuclease Y [bacterium]